MSKARKGRVDDGFSKLRQEIIKKALKNGLTMENLFSYNPPTPPPGQKHFPPILASLAIVADAKEEGKILLPKCML